MVRIGPIEVAVGKFLAELVGVLRWTDEVGATLNDIDRGSNFAGVV